MKTLALILFLSVVALSACRSSRRRKEEITLSGLESSEAVELTPVVVAKKKPVFTYSSLSKKSSKSSLLSPLNPLIGALQAFALPAIELPSINFQTLKILSTSFLDRIGQAIAEIPDLD